MATFTALYDALILLLKREGSPEALAMVARLERERAQLLAEHLGGRRP